MASLLRRVGVRETGLRGNQAGIGLQNGPFTAIPESASSRKRMICARRRQMPMFDSTSIVA